MLEFLKGKVISIGNDSFVLDMGSTGFEIASSGKTMAQIAVNKELCVFTKLIFKEDDIQLYGFATREERQMFCLLTTVSGIGPKAAVAILSGFSPGELAMCIIREDIDLLTSTKGIGKKTAGRLILELKDKMNKIKGTIDISIKDVNKNSNETNEINEAFSALVVLGYSEKDTRNTISGIYKHGMTVEEIVREALKTM